MDASELTPPAHATGVAATAVLLRDRVRAAEPHAAEPLAAEPHAAEPHASGSATGVEVLMLERPSNRGSFAGAWVFAGGAVDAADLDAELREANLLDLTVAAEERAARRAAARETFEETGLVVDPSELVVLSRWHPPRESPKRLRTWFYIGQAPPGPIVLEPDEAVDYRWLSPDAALQLHALGTLRLLPPTWVTLHTLAGAASVAHVLQRVREGERAEFATHMVLDGAMTLWQPDVAYGEPGGGADVALLDAEGPKHRLDMRARPWRYTRTAS